MATAEKVTHELDPGFRRGDGRGAWFAQVVIPAHGPSSRRKPVSSTEVDRASADEVMHELDPGTPRVLPSGRFRRGDGSGRWGSMVVIPAQCLSSRRKPGSSAEAGMATAEKVTHELDPGVRRGDRRGVWFARVVIPAEAGIQY